MVLSSSQPRSRFDIPGASYLELVFNGTGLQLVLDSTKSLEFSSLYITQELFCTLSQHLVLSKFQMSNTPKDAGPVKISTCCVVSLSYLKKLNELDGFYLSLTLCPVCPRFGSVVRCVQSSTSNTSSFSSLRFICRLKEEKFQTLEPSVTFRVPDLQVVRLATPQ